MPAKRSVHVVRKTAKKRQSVPTLALRVTQSFFLAIFLSALLVPSVIWLSEIVWPCREVTCWRQLQLIAWIPLATAVLLPLIYLVIRQTGKIPTWILWLSGAGVALWVGLYLHGIWFVVGNGIPGGLF